MQKTAVVTGAARGIGAGICSELSPQWRIVGIDQSWSEGDGAGVSIREVADVRDGSALSSIAARTVGDGCDLLVVNAGVARPEKPLIEHTDEEVDLLLSVNLRGAIVTMREFAPYLADGGSVVLISSTSALLGHAGGAVYAATKAGMLGLMRSCAAELAPRIRVNAVCPGGTDTPLTRSLYGDEEIDRLREGAFDLNPLGAAASVNDIGRAVSFLASAPRVTGVALRVDGGAGLAGFL